MAESKEDFRNIDEELVVTWADPQSPWAGETLGQEASFDDPETETKEFPVGPDRERRMNAPTEKILRPSHPSIDDTTRIIRFVAGALLEEVIEEEQQEPAKKSLLKKRKPRSVGYHFVVDPSLRRFQEHSFYGEIILPEVFEGLTQLTKVHLQRILTDIIASRGLDPNSLKIDELGRVVIPPRKRLRLKRRRLPAFRRRTEARQVLSLDEEIRRRFLADTRPALRELAERVGTNLGLPPDLVRLFRNRFLILGPVKSGENRHLLLARDLENDKLVALKVVLFQPNIPKEVLEAASITVPEDRFQESFSHEEQLFHAESRINERLNHPGIPQFIASDSTESGGYMAMEWLDGENVTDLLKDQSMSVHGEYDEHGELLRIGVLEMAIQLAVIVNHLHDERPQIINRDIKPSNIMMCNGVEVYLTDFGVSDEKHDLEGMITPQSFITNYSKAYAAPESVSGEPYNHLVDIYGIGAVMYFALTGKPPVPGYEGAKTNTETLIRILRSKVRREMPPAPHTLRDDVPQPLSDLVMRLISDASVRPTSGVQVVEELLRLRQELYPHLPELESLEADEEVYWSDEVVDPQLMEV